MKSGAGLSIETSGPSEFESLWKFFYSKSLSQDYETTLSNWQQLAMTNIKMSLKMVFK
jgi:hypothetical protein